MTDSPSSLASHSGQPGAFRNPSNKMLDIVVPLLSVGGIVVCCQSTQNGLRVTTGEGLCLLWPCLLRRTVEHLGLCEVTGAGCCFCLPRLNMTWPSVLLSLFCSLVTRCKGKGLGEHRMFLFEHSFIVF